MMNYEEFETYVCENLKVLLPEDYQDSVLRVDQITKPGFSYRGLRVGKSQEHYGIVVDLNHYYQIYRTPVPLSQIMYSIASLIREQVPQIDLKLVMDYEWVKPHLFIRVFNRTWCSSYLRNIPFKTIEDLAVSPHILASSDDHQISSTPVTYSLLDQLGVSAEQLMIDALENAMHLFPARLHYLADILGADRVERQDRILTNSAGINGAAALFYPGELQRIAEEVNGDFYAIPTSIHEAIITPAELAPAEETMQNSLMETLYGFTKQQEWLSDHIYYYDRSRQIFSSIRQSESRIRSA